MSENYRQIAGDKLITKDEIMKKISEAEEQVVDMDTIVYDKSKHSRVDGIDQSAVEDYSHSISTIPPLILNQNSIIINGVHCYKALQRAEQEKARIKQIELPDDQIKIASLLIDIDYGVRHPEGDKKRICIETFDGTPETNKYLIKELKVPKTIYYEWTEDVRNQLMSATNQSIVKTYLRDVEKTMTEIANDFGYTQSKISYLKNDITGEFSKWGINIDPEKVANNDKLLNFPNVGIINNDAENEQKDDKLLIDEEYKDMTFSEYLEAINLPFIKDAILFQPNIYNIWNIQAGDDTTSHFGHFPQEFIKNLLYYHTEPFDMIYDPFAGSGNVLDASWSMFRLAYGSDRKPLGDRKEIYKHDIKNGLLEEVIKVNREVFQKWIDENRPSISEAIIKRLENATQEDGWAWLWLEKAKDKYENIEGIRKRKLPKPDLIFLDPPYWKQSKEKYSEDDDDLANMTLEQFYARLGVLFDAINEKKIERIALVISPTQYPNENHEMEDHFPELNNILRDITNDKYEIEMRYILPYSTEQYNGKQIEIMKKERKAAVLNRDLIVWERRD